jgi:hypothetical protein
MLEPAIETPQRRCLCEADSRSKQEAQTAVMGRREWTASGTTIAIVKKEMQQPRLTESVRNSYGKEQGAPPDTRKRR